MPRAIYTEAHTQLWFDTAAMLQQEIGLEPCYWIGKPHAEPDVARLFPHAIFHSRTDAIRGVPPPGMMSVPQRPVDAAILSRYAVVQLTVGKMMDRLDVRDGFRFDERTRLFQIQLRYWRTVVEAMRPDIVIFPVQPHTVYDYVLYELCREYGIRTSMFQWTLFHDWLFPLARVDDDYEGILQRYRRLLASGLTEVQLPAAVEQYLGVVRGDYRKAVPDYLVEKMPAALRSALFGGTAASGDFGLLPQTVVAERPREAEVPFPSAALFLSNPRRARKRLNRFVNDRFYRYRRGLRSLHASARRSSKYARRRVGLIMGGGTVKRGAKRIRQFYRQYARMPLRGILAGDTNRPLKEPGKSMEQSFRGRFGGLRLQVMRIGGRFRKKELLRQYHDRCRVADYDAPYIFVALHYQPEQTTSPTGGVFVDQDVMVDMLARLVPPGWRIYVKEHPFQFFPESIGERSRTVEFYDDLLANPNVTLVPWSTSPFELIDRARAVATVCGTVGIETIMRGKPVFAFGYAWYRGCEGVFYTPSVDACRAAIDRIANGYQVDEGKVRLYLKAVEESCFRGDLNFGVHIEPIPHDENVLRIASGIRHLYEEPLRRSAAPAGNSTASIPA